jgi:hypothetical protein
MDLQTAIMMNCPPDTVHGARLAFGGVSDAPDALSLSRDRRPGFWPQPGAHWPLSFRLTGGLHFHVLGLPGARSAELRWVCWLHWPPLGTCRRCDSPFRNRYYSDASVPPEMRGAARPCAAGRPAMRCCTLSRSG